MQTNETPLRAEVLPNTTTVRLHLFGRWVNVAGGTTTQATWLANEWNQHFEKEWDAVRSATATIMNAFCEELKTEAQGHGVEPGTLEYCIRDAMATLQSDGE